MLLLASSGMAASEPVPTLQDMQLMVRVLGFQDRAVSGRVRLGVVFDPNNLVSRHEAQQVSTLLRDGLSIGGIDLGAVPIAQGALDQTVGIDAIFAAPGVDGASLRSALLRLHVPCLTVDRMQLGLGGCMVAMQSDPAVSVILDQKNAEAAGVHFATAFRMMVTEQ